MECGDTEKLFKYYRELGPRWKIIGEMLQRFPSNVRDKYKNLKNLKMEKPNVRIDSPWNLSQILKLIKYVNSFIYDVLDKQEKQIMLFPYKFSKRFKKGEYEGDRFIDIGEEIFLIDFRLKNFAQRSVINSFIEDIIQHKNLIDLFNKEISINDIDFEYISKKFDNHFTTEECSKKFEEIIRFIKEKSKNNNDELRGDLEININSDKMIIEEANNIDYYDDEERQFSSFIQNKTARKNNIKKKTDAKVYSSEIDQSSLTMKKRGRKKINA